MNHLTKVDMDKGNEGKLTKAEFRYNIACSVEYLCSFRFKKVPSIAIINVKRLTGYGETK